jgi:hypothetical protein
MYDVGIRQGHWHFIYTKYYKNNSVVMDHQGPALLLPKVFTVFNPEPLPTTPISYFPLPPAESPIVSPQSSKRELS